MDVDLPSTSYSYHIKFIHVKDDVVYISHSTVMGGHIEATTHQSMVEDGKDFRVEYTLSYMHIQWLSTVCCGLHSSGFRSWER